MLVTLRSECLKLSGSLQFVDLEAMLGSNAPQLDLASLKDSIVGYGFLTTAQYIADLFFAVADIPGVRNQCTVPRNAVLQ